MTNVMDDPLVRSATGEQEADWFEEWFGQDYLDIYQHRDETEAERAIELIATNLAGRQIDRVLDLACGAGRHTRALRAPQDARAPVCPSELRPRREPVHQLRLLRQRQ